MNDRELRYGDRLVLIPVIAAFSQKETHEGSVDRRNGFGAVMVAFVPA
jgi:hypothetical protein